MLFLLAIELGAGSGLPSIMMAKLGHSVICTDLPKVLPLIEQSFELNTPYEGPYECKVLEWGDKDTILPLADTPFDLIIAADLLYLEETFVDLVETCRLLAGPKT